MHLPKHTHLLRVLVFSLLLLPLMQAIPLHAGTGESASQLLPAALVQRVQQHLQDPWQVGERPRTIVVLEPETDQSGAVNPALGMASPEAYASLGAPAMDVDFEKRRMLFFARALALGLRVSYFRTANSSRDNGSIVNYGSTESDLILAFCLSYWLSNNWLLNANLGMDQLRRANRFGEEERSINRFRLATMAIGAGYFYPCFGNFGLMAEAEVGFGYGSDARRLITPTNDPVTTSLNAWSLQAGTYVGLWYAVAPLHGLRPNGRFELHPAERGGQ